MKMHSSLKSLIGSSLTVLLLLFTAGGCSTGSSGSNDSGPSFDSGFLAPGETFSFTFEKEGNVDYYCKTHSPDMTGEVIVQEGTANSGRDTVAMENIQFNPSQITIAPGTEIVWINRESSSVADHTITSGSPSSGNGDTGY